MSTAPAATAYTAPRRASVPVAQRFSTRVTGTFGSRSAKDSGRPERRNALVLVEHAEPCRVDPVALDAGVGDGFGERLDHQVVGAAVPALAEPRAAHADDRNLVADATGHVQFLTGVAFQK